MSKKEIKNLMFVLQLLLDDKKVEYSVDGEWVDLDPDDDELDSELKYREKPEPKVIYVNEYPDGSVAAYKDKARAEKSFTRGVIRVAVKYQEVL